MYNKHPSKSVEKKWLGRVAEYGCVITRQSNVQVHHCVGREGKQDKLFIGRFFVLPLAFHMHDVSESGNPLNITHHRNAFVAKFGKESTLFFSMCRSLEELEPLPFDVDVLLAILNTRK